MRICFLIILWYSSIFANKSIQNFMLNCLHHIADRYISSTIKIIVSNNTQHNCQIEDTSNLLSARLNLHDTTQPHNVIKKLQMVLKWPLMILQIEDESFFQEEFSSYILITDHCYMNNIIQDIRVQVPKVKINTYSKLIVLVTYKVAQPNIVAEKVLSVLREYKILNVIILISSDSDIHQDSHGSSIVVVYTWFPYEREGCCGNVSNPVLLDKCMSSDKGDNFFLKNELFPYKIPLDLHGCPLVVSSFEYPPFVLNMKMEGNEITYQEGIEVRLLEEFARRINLTIKYREPSPDFWGLLLENGSWNGATGEVIRGLSDMAIIGFWHKGDISGLEYSTIYQIDYLTWFVPCAKPIPRWKSLMRVFKLSLWFGFLSAYIIVSKVMSLVAKSSYNKTKKSSQEKSYSSFGRCLLYFWAIIVEESASNNLPNVTSIRLVFLTWILYCLAMNTVYQTFLISFLINPGLEHQISTEVEVIESDLTLGILDNVASCCLSNVENYPRRDHCKDFTQCMDRMAFQSDLALVFAQYYAEHVIHTKYMGRNGLPLVCKLPREVSFQFVTTPFTKGSFIREIYDKMVLRAIQSGLLEYWWDSLEYMTALTTTKFKEKDGEFVKLSIKHLESVFIFLLLGYIGSSITFAFEFLLTSNTWSKGQYIAKS
ncbi:Ionotropic receptor 576 [Blattella germanica]|nr:Ionotropic receptor 576 [Blattella germanica]